MNIAINPSSKSLNASNGSKFHSAILCATIVISSVLAPEIYSIIFAFLLLIYLFVYGIRIDKKTIRMFFPFMLIIPFGLIYAVQNDFNDAIRDFWYALKVFICFFVGYFISRKISNLDIFMNLFVRASFYLALFYLLKVIISFDQIDSFSVSKPGGFPLIASIALPLLLFCRRNYRFSGFFGYRYLMIFTLLAAFYLSNSRTSIGCLAIFILACLGLFDNVKRTIASIILIFLIAFIMYSNFLPEYDPENITLAGKISNSISEISFTDGVNKTEMIHNWRGFEAYQAYVSFLEASPLEKMFGQGLGATVNIGAEIQMSENMSYQFLPILHNGYMQVLTKYGLIGLFLYALFLIRVTFIRTNLSVNENKYIWITRGIGFVFIYTSLVITGLFNKEVIDSLLIYLGFMYGFSASLSRREILDKNVNY